MTLVFAAYEDVDNYFPNLARLERIPVSTTCCLDLLTCLCKVKHCMFEANSVAMQMCHSLDSRPT